MIKKILLILYILSIYQLGCYNNVNIQSKHVHNNSKILASAPNYEEAKNVAQEYGLKIVTTYQAISKVQNRWYGVFEQPESSNRAVASIISRMRSLKNEVTLEHDYRTNSFAIPDDKYFSKLWGMHDSSNVDIDAPEAWDINTGSKEVIVGVIDTGLNYRHADLKANVWINPNEIPGNGIDDDNNGYIDDIHGINGITDSGDPDDDHSHGSHIAGTIGAVGNNGIGVSGVCWNVKIMGLKFLNKSATGDTSDAIKCIDYAIDQKLKGQNIIALNNSWGDLPFTQVFTDAVEACKEVGIIFVAAAGNGGSDSIGDDNDARPVYPASFDFPHIITVAATTDLDKLCKFSNYGATSVDLGAPGIGIYSTKLKNSYGLKNGTSMAAPHVTGALALLASEFPNDTMYTRINRILDNVDPVPALSGKLVTGGRLNVYKALSTNNSSKPKANFTYQTYPNDLTVSFTCKSTSISSSIVNRSWEFGDGNGSSVQNPIHQYAQSGTYNVTLTVTTDDGVVDKNVTTVTVATDSDDDDDDGDDGDDGDDNDDDNSDGCN